MRRKTKIIFAAVVLFFGLAFVTDVSRRPENQLSARVYIGAVHLYQAVGRPLLEGKVACRFRPTCSDYSIQAVEKHGLIRGLVLTTERLYSCQNSVPMGTIDEVPAD
ncbi:MAG: membrane protein insertion efficiency factor YidD [Actinomycetota bacterium]